MTTITQEDEAQGAKDLQKNIQYDFSGDKALEGLLAGQPMAMMPASLAKRLLYTWAKNLSYATINDVREAQIQRLYDCQTEEELIVASIEFAQERQLISHCIQEDWEAYEIKPAT